MLMGSRAEGKWSSRLNAEGSKQSGMGF